MEQNTTEEINNINNQAYRSMAPQFAADAAVDPQIADYLEDLRACVPKGGLIVDVGCGAGQYTQHLRLLGERVMGVDLSPAMILEARLRSPELNLKVMDMRHLDFGENEVSGIVAIASLLHIPKTEAPQVLDEFRRVAHHKTPALFLMKMPFKDYSGDGFETRERSGVEVKRYFARYSELEFNALLRAHQFSGIQQDVITFPDNPREPVMFREPWLLTLAQVQK